MKAYEGTITKKGANAELLLIGANSMSAAAKKAEETLLDGNNEELVKIELTDKVIL